VCKQSVVVRALVAVALQVVCAAAFAGTPRMEDFAIDVAAEGKVVQSSANGRQVTGVVFRTDSGGCKMVGAWYDEWHRAIRNYRVCGSRASIEGSVARLPRGQGSEALVASTMKSAVMRGEATAKYDEFVIKAVRLPAADGGASCATELVITVDGLLSFYGIQESCN